ncbi:pyruvate kinase [Candidatus Saccharibacteria bacterium]|nr:pyruvate kinase [Candidatus Saccharibacteria bacterium]
MSTIFKRTKILATLGPATGTPEKVEELMKAGANGFRLNFSHGTHEERLEQIKWIRDASAQLERPVAVFQDLQGPKIRLGVLNDNRQEVKKGDEIILDYEASHNGLTLPIQYNLAEKVKIGEPIYLFDGKVKTTVVDIPSATAIKLRVENDGVLMSKKGINLPDTNFGGDILTAKDMEDIEFGATQDYDYVALSFVQSEEDINNLRQILVGLGSDAHIVAKIETKAAIRPEALEAIVMASDGVMVARGDLAVEAGAEVVPIIQRQIVNLCRKHGRLSIVATQMMASMVDAPEPTRAEVSDVATAVVQSADVVMLSDETANGNYPVETVAAMKKTIMYTQDNWPVTIADPLIYTPEQSRRNAISRAAVSVAEEIRATAIIAETKTGATAANIAISRPQLPICVVTSSARAAQQLALTYATRSFVRPDGDKAGTELSRELFAKKYFGEMEKLTVVIVSGRQPGITGGTDTLRVRVIE